jgi:hypothetical protein
VGAGGLSLEQATTNVAATTAGSSVWRMEHRE